MLFIFPNDSLNSLVCLSCTQTNLTNLLRDRYSEYLVSLVFLVNTVSHRTALFLLGPQLKERTWNSVSKRHVCHVLSKVMGVGKVD